MKTKYIIYTALALLVAYLIYNKFFSEGAKKSLRLWLRARVIRKKAEAQ
jgi:membrane fusion protein (multidrug efflux system)